MTSPKISVNHELQRLTAALQMYSRASKKEMDTVIREKAGTGKGAFQSLLKSELRAISPAKGAIRADRLARLKAGEGLRVRKAARDYADKHSMFTAVDLKTFEPSHYREKTRAGKIKNKGRSWWELAVSRELSYRETGRGFTAQTARLLRAGKQAMPDRAESESRYGPPLAVGTTKTTDLGTAVSFVWGPFSQLSADAVKALGRAKGQRAVAKALEGVRLDIIPFIDRKLGPKAAEILK